MSPKPNRAPGGLIVTPPPVPRMYTEYRSAVVGDEEEEDGVEVFFDYLFVCLT